MSAGPIDATRSPFARLRTINLDAFQLSDGFWLHRQQVNRRVSLRHGFEQLQKFGNFHNLALAAAPKGASAQEEYRPPVFMDSDVYKWLEAVGYELGRSPDAELQRMADHAIGLIEAAQGEDGYLNSYWQVVEPDRRWQDLQHGHELYCAGHLFQAAIAIYRGTGDERLLRVSCRFADYIDSVFGPNKRAGTPGHPEIETALVELYRVTGEPRYLDLALYFVDQRGKGLLGTHRLGSPAYYQDHVPVREAKTVEGHSVRQLYLTAGIADLYLERGEDALLAALERQWQDMTQRKLFITGGLGSQHAGEAFGEPYELPNERCYCETCAQIASIYWNWRMLLITGDSRYADLIERTLYNGFLSGVSLDGMRYFYVNPLLSHGADPLLGRKHVVRPEWHSCACCPPNVMRTLASLQHYFVTTDERGLQIQQYAPGHLSAPVPGGVARLHIETEFPWQGRVVLRVEESPKEPWQLRLRVPAWAQRPTVAVNGEPVSVTVEKGYVTLERAWQPGDEVALELEMNASLVAGHPRIDPTRASVAVQRGPLVYCFEEADQDATVDVLDTRIDPATSITSEWKPDLLGGVTALEMNGYAVDVASWGESLYRPYGEAAGDRDAARPVTLRAVPYYAWANRGPGKMRVWIPVHQGATSNQTITG